MRASLLFASASLAIGGCASVPRQAGYDEVARMVSERTGQKTHWDQGAPEDAEVNRRVSELLSKDLTEESAIEVALLNNRNLQATYEDLGVAQADLVQAGLLRNPSFGFSIRFPEGSVGIVNTELSLVQDFLDLFMLPLRKRLGAEQFEHAKLRLANEVFRLAGEVRQQYYFIQALQQLVELRGTVFETAQASAELSERQYKAGNIGELELETERGIYQQAKLDLGRDELQLAVQRERLTRLLGLWGSQTEWKISTKLADIPSREEGLEHLESLAIARRLDVATARQEAQVFAQALHVAKSSRFIGAVEVGVSRSTGPEPGIRVIGPTLRLELPIFDRRQALIRRLEAQLSQSEKRLAALSIDARSEVRTARLTLLSERQVVEHYRKVLLPIRERIVALSQQRYNAMLIGVFQLLLAKQAEVDAYRQYIDSVRDYWIARAELERAVGGPLKSAQQSASEPQRTSLSAISLQNLSEVSP
jgi:cobalt-zinc-cadmium efflux system outer membrane protein